MRGEAVAAADEQFGVDMYQVLAQDAADTVFSPVSVASVLLMALCGARGKTAGELAGALHVDASPDAAAGGLRWLSSALGAVTPDGAVTADGSVTLRAPDTVWVQSGLPLLPPFTSRLREAGDASLADADFARSPEAARAQVNRVIAEQTAGKITGLLPPGSVDALTRLVLASAVYLKARWARPFPGDATRDEPFYPEGRDGPGLPVPMMLGTAPRDYVRGDGYQAVLLPYAGARLAMAVILPDESLAGLHSTLAGGGAGWGGSGLRGLLAGAARHQVTLAMPRFRLEAAFNLIPVLQRLGVREAFGDDADFTGMTEAEKLKIGAIAHKAYIDVDEHGTEAAAATAAVMVPLAAMRTPPPVTMVVDRPFMFAIIETGAGLPLFLGQVTHPGSP
jgi:serpin B